MWGRICFCEGVRYRLPSHADGTWSSGRASRLPTGKAATLPQSIPM